MPGERKHPNWRNRTGDPELDEIRVPRNAITRGILAARIAVQDIRNAIRENRRIKRMTLEERQAAWDRTDETLRMTGEGLDPNTRPGGPK